MDALTTVTLDGSKNINRLDGIRKDKAHAE
jgi:hypothetical protein